MCKPATDIKRYEPLIVNTNALMYNTWQYINCTQHIVSKLKWILQRQPWLSIERKSNLALLLFNNAWTIGYVELFDNDEDRDRALMGTFTGLGLRDANTLNQYQERAVSLSQRSASQSSSHATSSRTDINTPRAVTRAVFPRTPNDRIWFRSALIGSTIGRSKCLHKRSVLIKLVDFTADELPWDWKGIRWWWLYAVWIRPFSNRGLVNNATHDNY